MYTVKARFMNFLIGIRTTWGFGLQAKSGKELDWSLSVSLDFVGCSV
jgi:hypothetical protein